MTREEGRIEAIAKGARKSGSRLAGSSEPLVMAQMQLSKGKARAYVTQVVPQSSFPGIRSDYERLTMGLALAELYVAISHPGQVEPELFDLLVRSLGAVEVHAEPTVALVWCLLKLMDIEGVSPSWTLCVHTGRKVAETPAWLSPSAGGYLSPPEASDSRDRFQVQVEVLVALEKTSALDDPPPRLKFARECLGVAYRFWLHAAHTSLPAFESLLRDGGYSSPNKP